MANEKIVPIEALVNLISKLKQEGKKIIYAHGAFDLLHAGHIHHLEEAKKMGDVLIVTITSDRFISKGSDRPRFKESERAKFVAELECVDFVSLNDSLVATSVIKKLRPNIYVKGEDVKEKMNDPEEGLYQEIKELEACGGRIQFIPSLPIHSMELLDEFFSVYPSDVTIFLERFKKKYSFDQVVKALDQIRKLKILVIGDAIVDSYQYVIALGKSPKGSHMVTSCLEEEIFAGGAMACANHVAGFCDDVNLVTCLGSDNSRREFISSRLKENVVPHFFYRKGPTTFKKRFVESAYVTKLFETHEFDDSDLSAEIAQSVCKWLENRLNKFDLVLVADYGHGFLVKSIIELIARKAKFLALDVQTNSANYGFNLVTKYSRAHYVCIDEPEARLAVHSRIGKLDKLIELISQKTLAEKISVTCGHKGCMTFEKQTGFYHIPVLSTKVVDTVGAGDAFFSVSSPWASLDLPMELVGFVGNIAGAIKVGTVCNKVAVDSREFIKFTSRLLRNN